jgi:hypothetical protein
MIFDDPGKGLNTILTPEGIHSCDFLVTMLCAIIGKYQEHEPEVEIKNSYKVLACNILKRTCPRVNCGTRLAYLRRKSDLFLR